MTLLNEMRPPSRAVWLLLWLAFLLVEPSWWVLGRWLGYADFSEFVPIHRFPSAILKNVYDAVAAMLTLLILPAMPIFYQAPKLMNGTPILRIEIAALLSSVIYLFVYLLIRTLCFSFGLLKRMSG